MMEEQVAPVIDTKPQEQESDASNDPSSPTSDKENHFSKRLGNILTRSKRGRNKRLDSSDSLSTDKNQNGSTASLEEKKSPKVVPKQRKLSNIFRRSKSHKSVDEETLSSPSSPTKTIPGDGVNEPENGAEPSMMQRRMSHTKYSESRSIVVGGKATREVEVTGEKPEVEDKKSKKPTKKKSGDDLAVPCRDLGNADFDGWLFKKSGGFGSWKKLWCVLKSGVLYVYKTSFDAIALNVIKLSQHEVVLMPDDKRKFAFRCNPKTSTDDSGHAAKSHSFSAETQESVTSWVDNLKKAAQGIAIVKVTLETPEQDRRRCYSSASKKHTREPGSPNSDSEDVNRNMRRPQSTAFAGTSETTGMPSSFERQGSTSRPRRLSTSGKTSVLAVGSMFQSIESPDDDSPMTEKQGLTDLLYKKTVIVVENGDQSPEEAKEIHDLKQDIKNDMEILQHTTAETSQTEEPRDRDAVAETKPSEDQSEEPRVPDVVAETKPANQTDEPHVHDAAETKPTDESEKPRLPETVAETKPANQTDEPHVHDAAEAKTMDQSEEPRVPDVVMETKPEETAVVTCDDVELATKPTNADGHAESVAECSKVEDSHVEPEITPLQNTAIVITTSESTTDEQPTDDAATASDDVKVQEDNTAAEGSAAVEELKADVAVEKESCEMEKQDHAAPATAVVDSTCHVDNVEIVVTTIEVDSTNQQPLAVSEVVGEVVDAKVDEQVVPLEPEAQQDIPATPEPATTPCTQSDVTSTDDTTVVLVDAVQDDTTSVVTTEVTVVESSTITTITTTTTEETVVESSDEVACESASAAPSTESPATAAEEQVDVANVSVVVDVEATPVADCDAATHVPECQLQETTDATCVVTTTVVTQEDKDEHPNNVESDAVTASLPVHDAAVVEQEETQSVAVVVVPNEEAPAIASSDIPTDEALPRADLDHCASSAPAVVVILDQHTADPAHESTL